MRLESLPQEVIVEIISHMSAHDLTVFARTSKFFYQLVQPRLWTNIELHHASFHEPESIHREQSRKRGLLKPTRIGISKAESLLKQLRPLSFHARDDDQLEQLASRIQSLSIVLKGKPDYETWNTLPYLTNLRYMEVHGTHQLLGWNYMFEDRERTLRRQLDISRAGGSNLRHVKLYGYIPRSFAAWVLRSGVRLERLELGMLEAGIDYEEPSGHPDSQYEFYPSDRLHIQDETWCAIPRPLGGFLPSEVWEEEGSQGLELELPRLKHIHLCQPCRGDDAIAADSLYYWSSGNEEDAHKSWRQLLVASRSKLETLVLEQRIGVDYSWQKKHKELFDKPDKAGIGSARLLQMVGQLLAKDCDFPALKHVQLRGIFVGSDDRGRPVAGSPISDFMALMQKLGVKCEARRGRIGWFDGDDGGTRWDAWKTDHENRRKALPEANRREYWTELDSEELLGSV